MTADTTPIADGEDPEGNRVALRYDHAAARYELVHFAHAGLEATLGFVAVDAAEHANAYRLLRRRELGVHARGYQVEGDPTEAFGEAVGAALRRIEADEHPDCADHAHGTAGDPRRDR